MRNLFQFIYVFCLRACGVLGLGFAVMLILGLPGAFMAGKHVVWPLVAWVPGIGVALVCAFTRLRPRWATGPNRILHGIGLFFIVSVMAIPIILLPLAAVIVWEVAEPMGKMLAIGGAMTIALPAQVVQWLGLILGCWPDGSDAGPAREKVEEFVPKHPALGTDDLRALRLSRMGG